MLFVEFELRFDEVGNDKPGSKRSDRHVDQDGRFRCFSTIFSENGKTSWKEKRAGPKWQNDDVTSAGSEKFAI